MQISGKSLKINYEPFQFSKKCIKMIFWTFLNLKKIGMKNFVLKNWNFVKIALIFSY